MVVIILMVVCKAVLTFRPLGGFPGLVETWLLPFDLSRVSCEQIVYLHRLLDVRIDLRKRSC